jgi:ribosomal protein L40E
MKFLEAEQKYFKNIKICKRCSLKNPATREKCRGCNYTFFRKRKTAVFYKK